MGKVPDKPIMLMPFTGYKVNFGSDIAVRLDDAVGIRYQ